MIDFENMKPGTLLLVKDDSEYLPGEVVVTDRIPNTGYIYFRFKSDLWCLYKDNIECVVPPKPEIEGWEAVEFRAGGWRTIRRR